MQQTLVIIKPDAVDRGLTGEILVRFERSGLRIAKLKALRASREVLSQHYPNDDEWLRSVGQKTLDDYERQGLDADGSLGTSDALEIGRMVRRWLIDFMASGDVVVMLLEGNRAVQSVRKLVGETLPVDAKPGTIRGDYSTDSPDIANQERRPVKNLIHASGDADDAEREIGLWLPVVR